MSEAIKLFGKTISLPPLYHLSYSNDSCFEATGDDFSYKTTSSLNSAREQQGQEINRESSGKEITDDKQEVSTSNQETEDSKDPTTTTTSSSGINEKPKTSSADRETSPSKEISKNGEEEEKTLKKPDKILPCPRCKSMDTKFCYFNNYNVNQPRHFCKNCQRYWTAGGTMRNVPVGAGRRKNKSSPASHYRHIIVSDSLRTSQVHAVNSSTVLSFGADSPLCESVTSVLNFSEKNGYHRTEQRLNVSCGRKADDKDDRSSGNSVTTSQETVTKNYHQGVCPQVQYFPGSPWPYPWNSTMPSGFPVSFYPYWGCTVPHPWNVPPCLSPTSPLGKHSREVANSEEPSRETNCSERSVSARKALRIDDPTEAAKSSMWATLGIKTGKSNLNNGGGIFNGFQLKHHENINYTSEIQSSVLQANPAALSRSLKFHEST